MQLSSHAQKARDPETVKVRPRALNYNQNNDGTGIKAAAWAGAKLDPVGATMVFDRGVVAPGVDAGYTDEEKGTWAANGQFNLGSQPFLSVDRHGERICNESANYDARCFAAASHPGGVWCQVFDANAPADVQRFRTQGCSAMTWQSALKDKTVDEAYDEKYISKGLMMKADTLDELADKLGFTGDDKTAFLATVENYNKLYDSGVDSQFGKEGYRLSAIRQAPFYGAWYGGSLLTTIDGVRVDKHWQAIDEDCNPIEGLFVVGTNSGSYYAGNYPVYLVGNCLGRQVTSGPLHAARYLAATSRTPSSTIPISAGKGPSPILRAPFEHRSRRGDFRLSGRSCPGSDRRPLTRLSLLCREVRPQDEGALRLTKADPAPITPFAAGIRIRAF